MALDTSQVLRQGRTFVRGLTDRQKALIAASMVAVAAGLWLFVSLLGRGDYTLLYSGLDPAEASNITRRLADEGIPSQMSADGKSLSVPADRLDKARLDMAAQGLPQSGRLGFEIFDKPNWGESDFAEKVNYQRALEGELERTIQELSDVEAVRVHLVMPHESLFSDREREAKASVLVKLRNGRLSERSLKAITYLVASAVDTLQPSNVTVVDAEGNVPIVMRGGVKPGSPEGATEYEQALDQKLAATLTPILGADHFVARATVEYDPGSSENTQEIYDPKDSVVLTSQVTGDDADGSGDAGIPGAASNVPQNQSSNANSNDSAASAQNASAANANSADDNAASEDDDEGGETSDSKTYAVGRTVVHTIRPSGTIRKISAAILVDDTVSMKVVGGHKIESRQPLTPAEIKQIQAVSAAVLGLDPSRGDVVTVENIPFQITSLQPSGPISTFKRIEPFLNQYGYFVRYIVLGFLGLLLFLFVVRPLMKQVGAGAHEPALPEATEPTPALQESTDLLGEAGRELVAMESAGEMSEGNQQRQKVKALKEALTARVTKTPAEASYVIGGWLKESES